MQGVHEVDQTSTTTTFPCWLATSCCTWSQLLISSETASWLSPVSPGPAASDSSGDVVGVELVVGGWHPTSNDINNGINIK
jgi:hypothetical protein